MMEKQIKDKKKNVEKNPKGIYQIIYFITLVLTWDLNIFFAFLKIKEQLNQSIIF